MLYPSTFLTFVKLQEQVGWDPVVRDHRGSELAIFLLGTSVVALIVIALRIVKARREKPASRRMLE